MSGVISCPSCGNTVAIQREGGAWEMRHKKRMQLVAAAGVPHIIEMQCEECGALWNPQDPQEPVENPLAAATERPAPRMGSTGRLAMPTIRRVVS